MLVYFAPAKWAAALANVDKTTAFPEMTLKMLDESYTEGLAARVVDNNIRGLYTLGRPHEPIVDDAVAQTAEIFVSKYGTDLSIFGMLLYFAQYLTDYKSTYGQFDLIDVLRQCGKSFLPEWHKRLAKNERKEHKIELCRETGRDALYSYLRRMYVAKGIDLRTSPIVELGSFTDEELSFIESCEPLPL